MQELAGSEGIEVDCLGDRLYSVSQSFVGSWPALERMSFDWAFLGAEDGICETDHVQTRGL